MLKRAGIMHLKFQLNGMAGFITSLIVQEMKYFEILIIFYFEECILISALFFNLIMFVAIDAETQKVWGWAQGELLRWRRWVYISLQGTFSQPWPKRLDQIPAMAAYQKFLDTSLNEQNWGTSNIAHSHESCFWLKAKSWLMSGNEKKIYTFQFPSLHEF